MTDDEKTNEEISCHHDNITDEKSQRQRIEFERSFSIGTQDTTYDYNDEIWKYI